MKKSMFMAIIVLSAMVAMSSIAFAAVVYDVRHPTIEVRFPESTSYAKGVFGAQLYEGRKQLLVYGGSGSPLPDYGHEIWGILEGLNSGNTPIVSSDGKTRWPSPWVFPGNVQSIDYYILGDSGVLDEIKTALSGTGIAVYYGDSGSALMTQTAIGVANTALLYAVRSGLVAYIPTEDQYGQLILNVTWLKALLAADSFRF
jgi:hypothetical protein